MTVRALAILAAFVAIGGAYIAPPAPPPYTFADWVAERRACPALTDFDECVSQNLAPDCGADPRTVPGACK